MTAEVSNFFLEELNLILSVPLLLCMVGASHGLPF
jgi:hypothetical protein